MKKAVAVLAVLAVVGLAAFFFLTAARPLPAEAIPAHIPDLANGKRLYTIGGCISCHKPPEDAAGADKTLPSGGRPLPTPIGTFYPPNLTPDAVTGIGTWSDADFVNAMTRGLSPDGRHYFPAFPFTSYARMKVEDLLDIKGYLMSLPAVSWPARPPDVFMLWLARRSVGMWKYVGLDADTFAPDPAMSAQWNAGAYLVAGPGHCGECHTPRNLFMVSEMNHWLGGGPHPEGKGKVPSLRDLVGRGRFKDKGDLVLAFQWGEAFGYDKISAGGMGSVQANLSQMPESDLQAIAEYLTSLK
jgi:mono/diheme cytochrome c family protein